MSHIHSHPPEDMLLGYTSGKLQDGFNMVLGCHINMCPTCRESLHLHQEIGGEMICTQTPTGMNTSAQATLDMLRKECEPSPKVIASPSNHNPSGIPFPLSSHLGEKIEKLKWQKLAPGLKQHVLDLPGQALARLIWIGKGVSVPSHGHNGDELTLVLSGGYYDGEQSFTKGDLQWADHASPHQPIAMDDGPCLTLAVTDAPIVFQNILPKLLQPFFKI